MESTFLWIGKESILLKLFKYLIYNFYLWLEGVFDVHQNVIQVHHHEDVGFLSQNTIDIAFEAN